MALLSPNPDVAFDLDSNGIVDVSDRVYWMEELAQTVMGDADLDQDVDFADFLALSDSFGHSGGWANGDFTGDGQIRFEDFLALSNNFGNVSQAAITSERVPEPSSLLLLVVVMSFGLRWRATRNYLAV